MTASPVAIVVGGGITGLSAAFELSRRPACKVVVLEASGRLGGTVRTDDVDGVPVDAGPDWFVTTDPSAIELCRELGLEDDLVPPLRRGASLWRGRALRPFPENTVRGIPLSPWPALRSGLLSRRGAMRALGDLVLPGPLTGPDVPLGAFLRRRFGNEVVETLVAPLIAASRAGSIDGLSLAAAAPEIDAVARSHRSVARGLRRLPNRADGPPPFLGVRGGMERMITGIAARLQNVDIRTRVSAGSIEQEGSRYAVATDAGRLHADAVIVAVPAPNAARLLERAAPDAAAEIAGIPYSAGSVATLTYPPSAGRAPSHGSGFLTSPADHRTVTAAAWFSEKWDHARTPDGSTVVRAFVARDEAGDEAVVDAVVRELSQVAGFEGPPRAWTVARWPVALPEYRVGHRERVARIEAAVSRLPRVKVAGASYLGSGLPDCIRQGRAAARAVASELRSSPD